MRAIAFRPTPSRPGPATVATRQSGPSTSTLPSPARATRSDKTKRKPGGLGRAWREERRRDSVMRAFAAVTTYNLTNRKATSDLSENFMRITPLAVRRPASRGIRAAAVRRSFPRGVQRTTDSHSKPHGPQIEQIHCGESHPACHHTQSAQPASQSPQTEQIHCLTCPFRPHGNGSVQSARSALQTEQIHCRPGARQARTRRDRSTVEPQPRKPTQITRDRHTASWNQSKLEEPSHDQRGIQGDAGRQVRHPRTE